MEKEGSKKLATLAFKAFAAEYDQDFLKMLSDDKKAQTSVSEYCSAAVFKASSGGGHHHEAAACLGRGAYGFHMLSRCVASRVATDIRGTAGGVA